MACFESSRPRRVPARGAPAVMVAKLRLGRLGRRIATHERYAVEEEAGRLPVVPQVDVLDS